ncbi:MAG: hypothetical protein HY873_10075 [Chloroflexi bacterium]|nr:hypothetical protein [Chloroflexota bacterium]
MTIDRLVTLVLLLGGLFFLGPGLWALLDPDSFYRELAPFEPYNRHFVHDIGAFQIGIGVALLLAAWWSDAKLIVLAGAAAAAVAHLVSHVMDNDHGGNDTDVPVFAIVAAVLLVTALARWISTRPQPA